MQDCITHTCFQCDGIFFLEAPNYLRTWCRPCRLTYMRTYNASYKAPLQVRKCVRCDAQFEGTNSSKYCSDGCRFRCPKCDGPSTGHRTHCASCRTVEVTCLVCAAKFRTTPTGRPRKYCSPKCKGEAARIKVDRTDPTCPWCYCTFPYAPNKKHCSQRCMAQRRDHLKIYRAPDRCHLPVCVDCKQVYSAMGVVVAKRGYRCAECSAISRTKAQRTGWKKKNAARRSLIKAGEKIDTDEIGDRDSWICHLCDEPIDQSLSAPHPGSKTLDHVIPLNPRVGERGTHTASNVKIAHYSCNSSKSDRLLKIAS